MADFQKQFKKLIKNIIEIKDKEDDELLEIELKAKLISFLNIFYNQISLSIITNINKLNDTTKELFSDDEDNKISSEFKG